MKTNSMKMINKFIRRGGGANLNLFRFAAMVAMLLMLGIGNAWASSYYASLQISKAGTTGAGKVYVAKTNTKPSSETGVSSAVKSDATSSSGGNITFYYWVDVTSPGYYVTLSGEITGTYTGNTGQKSVKLKASTTADGTKAHTATATFSEITIDNGTASPATIAAEDNSTTSTANTCSITYATKGDAQNDFQAPSVGNATGNGTFTATWNSIASDGKATVDVKFVGDGTYGGKNKAAANRSRTSSAVVTLTSTVGNNKGTCTVNASFPNIIVSAGEGADMYTTNGEPKSASATFPVQWADDADDFTAAFSGATGGGTWTVDAITYTATDAQSGVVTVDYTFDNERNADAAGTVNHSAVLTLSANTNAGGASNTVTLNAESKKAASGDAVVVSGSDETEYETLAEAIEAANALNTNPTVRLQRNVALGTLASALEIKKPMTLDLASFEISATVNSSVNKLFYLNSTTAVLTVNDSKNGGAITVTGSHTDFLYAILVDKGALNITKGDITISNTNTGATAKAAAVCVGSNGRFGMSGGNLTSTTAGSYAYGLVTTTVPSATESTVGITGGTITATAAKTMGIGIYCQSTSATASGDPTAANVVLSGVTVNASTAGTTDAYAIQVDAGVSLLINSGTYTATSQTQTAYALNTKGYVAVLNGTFNANATTLLARGIHLAGGITAVRNGSFTATAATEQAHAAVVATGAKLLVYGGTFTGKLTNATGSAWATGTYVNGGSLEAQGGTFVGNIAKSGLSAVQTNYAAGVYAYTGSTVSLASAVLRGQTANVYVNGAYGLYTTTANALGLTNCTLYGTSAHQYAYGIYNAGTPVTMNNTTLEVNSTKEYSYGIYTNAAAASIEAKNSTVNSTSASTYAYGAYVANGTLNASNTTFDVTVSQTAAADSYLRGLYVATGKSASLTDCKVTATGTAAYSNNGYGLYVDGSMDVENTEVTVSGINSGAYAIVNSANTSLINIASGKFKATATSTGVATNGTAAAAKQKLYGGYYTTNTNLSKYLADGYMVENLTAGDEFNAGYKYQVRPAIDIADPVCKIGAVGYGTLEEALEYANKNATSSNKLTIYMVANYTLPAGNYVLPQYTTLLVPYKSGSGAGATTAIGTTASRNTTKSAASARTAYKTLTFAAGAKMTVYGTIEASAQQYKTAQTICGDVAGAYGHIVLNEGANITLESGAVLISWGFVTGKGEIEAKNGAKAYEMVQTGWYKGGNTTSTLYNNTSYKVFVLTDYAYQNIECPIKYHPGAQAVGSASTDYFSPDNVELVGTTNNSFFKMVPEEAYADTWVKKEYDPKTDYTTWTMNNGASLSALKLENYSTANFYLPITSNFRIVLNYGVMTISGDVEFLPGSELIVKKEAVGKIASGKYAFFYDNTDWCTGLGASGTGQYYYAPDYSPSWKAATGSTSNPRVVKYKQTASQTSKTDLPDASLYVQGVLDIEGYLYTTGDGNKASVGRNANIYSSNDDAGKIIYTTAAPNASKTMYKATHAVGMGKGSFSDMIAGGNSTSYPAHLKNADGAYEQTANTTSGSSWIYKNDHWVMVTTEGCFSVEQISGVKHYYAYPAEFVEVTSKNADATTHLYTDAATGNRRFLVEDDCTWWEVEPTPYDGNKYKCVNPDHNGRYKYYEYVSNQWQEAVVTITWKSGTSTLATYNSTLYGTRPKYLDPNPKKDKTTTEYYTWLGWTKGSETGEFFTKDAELPVATENTTYYAYFQTTKFQHRITLKNYDESIIYTQLWNAGEKPVYDGTPLKPSTTAKEYTFDGWATSKTGAKAYEIDGLPAASAAATYYAHYAESDRKYTITWVNYDGTVLKEEQVAYSTTPSAPVTPTRPNDNYYTYTFDAWSPAIATVTGDQTYTATYTYEKKVPKYEVLFKNGATTIFSQNLVENTVPVFDGTEPTKAATAQYTYTFDGWSTTNGGALAYAKNAALPALTANVTYYAHFAATTNTYNVYWRSEDGKTLLHTDNNVAYGVATPAYDGTAPTKPRVGTTQYALDGWSATIGGTKVTSFPTISGNATYYARFVAAYEVTFDMQGHGSPVATQTIANGGKVSQPAAPEATGYSFDGWYKEAACTNAWNFSSDVVTAGMTLYAKWTPIEYTITWKVEGKADETTQVEYDAIPVYPHEAPYKAPGDEFIYTFDGWLDGSTTYAKDATLPAVTGETTYTAQFEEEARPYTITWLNYDGTELTTSSSYWGESPGYPAHLDKPTRTDEEHHMYRFNGWSPAIHEVSSEENVYTAQYELVEHIEVSSGEPEPITVDVTVTTTTVYVEGNLEIAEDVTLTTDDLILEGAPTTSGEITGRGRMSASNAYFHFKQDGGFKAKTWYAVAVPWEVDAETGVSVNGNTMTLGRDFDLIYYDGDRRAQGATKAWNYVEDDNDKIMHPGRAYMIYLAANAPAIRFKRAGNAELHNTSVTVNTYTGNDAQLNNWNGIANPALYHAYVNAGADDAQHGLNYGQVYDAETKSYKPLDMAANKLVVGQPIFVQAAEAKTFDVSRTEYASSLAPRRVQAAKPVHHEVSLISATTGKSDIIVVRMNEDKEENAYTVGQDLAKMGVSSVVPQLWIDRYDSRLCIHTAIPSGNEAEYPLSLYAPQAGEYQIAIHNSAMSNQQSDMLYLTYDGRAIWNLTYAPYTLSLDKETNTHYGLRVVASPAVATGMDEATIRNGNAVRKVLIDDHVFIIRNGEIYSTDGRLIK